MALDYYKVNPLIFVVMYCVKSVIFWWTVALILKYALRRRWEKLPPLVLTNVCFNVSPWAYIWLCGENYPFWYPYMVYFIGGWGLCYLAWDVYRRLKAIEAASAPTEQAPNPQEGSH